MATFIARYVPGYNPVINAAAPYLVPLFLVYWSEYAIQAGTWTAIAFDPTKVAMHSARDEAYRELNFLYQWGVFVSRSSGMLVSAIGAGGKSNGVSSSA